MRCPQCPHCQALVRIELAELILPPRPRGGGRTGVDHRFYKAYGMAYDAAVARFAQPMRKIREANPGLTANQCRVYLKRARALGLVTTPALVGRVPGGEPAAVPGDNPVPAAAPAELPTPAPVDDAADDVAEDDRPAWLLAWPLWLAEDVARWLCEQGTVSAYDYAVRTLSDVDGGADPKDSAREDLADLAEAGVGTWNGTTFRVTAERPPAANRGGRPRKVAPSIG